MSHATMARRRMQQVQISFDLPGILFFLITELGLPRSTMLCNVCLLNTTYVPWFFETPLLKTLPHTFRNRTPTPTHVIRNNRSTPAPRTCGMPVLGREFHHTVARGLQHSHHPGAIFVYLSQGVLRLFGEPRLMNP